MTFATEKDQYIDYDKSV